jgi:hypothetical protein
MTELGGCFRSNAPHEDTSGGIAFKPTEETLTDGEAAKLQKRQIKRMHD